MLQIVRRAYMRPGRVRRVPVGLARGLRLEIDPAAPVHVHLGTSECEIAPHIRALVRPGCACLDIGGHNAYYALVLARRSGRRVATFDFDPAAVARMRRNLALNPGVGELVDVHRLYLGHERDVAAGTDTLDGAIRERGLTPPDFIKIDVEGAEATVLSGARNTLARLPNLIIETHGAAVEQACVEILRDFGYRPRVVTQRRHLREHRPPDNRWLVARGAGP